MDNTKKAQELLEQIKTSDVSLIALNGDGKVLVNHETNNMMDIYGITDGDEHFYGVYGDIAKELTGQVDSRHYGDEAVLEAIKMFLAWVDENNGKLIKREDYKNPNPKEPYYRNYTYIWK